MARTIEQIEATVTAELRTNLNLSTSAVAEWRMWTHCVAVAIHTFELILDLFKTEMDNRALAIVPGSLTWYNEMCYRFQNGHELLFDRNTAKTYYAVEAPAARIIKIAAVEEVDGVLIFRVATQDEENEIIPLTDMQLLNFKNYINTIKFAGSRSSVISTSSDLIRYSIEVYHDPAVPESIVRERVIASLESFKTEEQFGGVIYRHKVVDAITRTEGAVTAKIVALQSKSALDTEYSDIETRVSLHAGYFNYSDDCVLNIKSVYDL